MVYLNSHVLVTPQSESETKLEEELDYAEVPDFSFQLLSEVATDEHYKAHLYGNKGTSQGS